MTDLKETFKLLVTLLAISLLVLLCSCGSRKVQKSVLKESLTTEQATTEKKDITIDSQTKTVINEDADEIEVKPIDTSKTITVNGKKYKNAIVTLRKKKVNTVIENKEMVKDNSVKIDKKATVLDFRTVQKDIEKKSTPLLPLLWLLVPIGAVLLYRYQDKFSWL